MRTEAEKIHIAMSFLQARGFVITKGKSAVKPPRKTVSHEGFMRQPEVLALMPFSSATLWRKCSLGTFPKPVKLSERVTAWRAEEIRQWLDNLDQ